MSEENRLQREQQKEALRKGVVENPALRTEEDVKKFEQKQQHREKRVRLLFGGILLILLVGFLGFRIYDATREYRKAGVRFTRESANDSGRASYASFRDGVVEFSTSGARFLQTDGEVRWAVEYDLRNPAFYSKDDQGILYDAGGRSFVRVDAKKGLLGTAVTRFPISRVALSKSGITALVQEDSEASFISFYRKDAVPLDIEIKAPLTVTGYPLAMDLSPDGTELMVSYLYVKYAVLQNKIAFYNFGTDGKETKGRLVGSFDLKQESVQAASPYARFFSNNKAAAITDHGIVYFSTENRRKPVIGKTIDVSDKIMAVDSSDSYVLLLTVKDQKNTLLLYDTAGKELFRDTSDFPATEIELGGNLCYTWNDKDLRILTKTGKQKFRGTLAGGIDGIHPASSLREFFLNRGDRISMMTMH